MLILERREGSSIRIGEDVSVAVRAIRGNAVKLVVRAPRHVTVLRDELLEREWKDHIDPPEKGAKKRRNTENFGISVIEDDPAHAQIIRLVLTNRGYTNINLFQTGTEAIEGLVEKEPNPEPGLVLLDFRLPDFNGLEVLRSLRASEPLRKTPIVMLSSCTQDEHVKGCLEAGANAFVEKSPSFDEMEHSLRTITDFWAHQRVRA